MAPNLVDCVIHWKKKIDKNSDDEDVILNVIRKLSKISITPEILEVTHIGKTIRNLSKRNDAVGERAKILLNKWRNIFLNLESVRNSKQKSISNKDAVEKCSSKQNLTQEKTVYDERASSHEQKEKHKNNSSHHSSSKCNQSPGESEMKRPYLSDVDFPHNIEARITGSPHSPETFSSDGKRRISRPSDYHAQSSLKRKLKTDEQLDSHTSPLSKKNKSENYSSCNRESKKEHSIHVTKNKSQSSKKDCLNIKSEGTNFAKPNSSASKVKIQSSEEFTSSSVSFEDCLGFNDIVPVKKKKSSKSQISVQKPSPDSVHVKKRSADKKVTGASSPVNVPTKSSPSSEGKPSGNVSKKSTMFDASKCNSSFLSAIQVSKQQSATNEDVIKFTSSRKEKTAIYSGRKNCNKGIPTLAQCCYRVLIENIDILGAMSDTPYSLLKPILEKCTPNQLFTIEQYNPHLLDYTNELWKLHCKRDYKLLSPLEHETWRDVYLRGFDEREEKLKNITANISASMLKATPVRQVKLAFIDSYVKPPRDVLRRQAKSRCLESGTNVLKPGISSKASTKTPAAVPCSSSSEESCVAADKNDFVERISESFRSESPPKRNTKPVVPLVDPNAIIKDTANMNLITKKPKVAPLMAKTLKAMKQCFRR